MTAKDFLHQKLQPLSDKFNMIFSYQFDSRSDMHLVVVSPVEAYNNLEYGELELNITQEFDRLFRPECILFVADNDVLVSIDTPEFIISPKNLFKPSVTQKIKWKFDNDAYLHNYALAA
jgi:hypothetical protein